MTHYSWVETKRHDNGQSGFKYIKAIMSCKPEWLELQKSYIYIYISVKHSIALYNVNINSKFGYYT